MKPGFETHFTGMVRGVISEPKQNGDGSKKWTEHNFCVEGADFETFKFRITREDVEKNIMPELDKFKGKNVRFKCFASNRAWKDRVYTDHYFSGSMKIVDLKDS